MQPVLVPVSDVPGVICLNGQIAGEVDSARAPALPVSAYGAVIVEHRPFGGDHLPLCVRLAFSAGSPLPSSLEGMRGVSAVCWPGVTELMLRPARLRCPEQAALADGLELRLRPGAGELICRTGAGCTACDVPENASMPQVARLSGAVVLTGDCPDGRYVIVLDEGCHRVLFSDRARGAAVQPDGTLRLTRALDDLPGHAQAETWLPGAEMNAPLSVEPAWLEGAPRAPSSPAETALVAVRAAQLDEMDEAMRCFHPAFPCREALAAAAAYDGALPLKYPVPDGRPCIGLVKALNDAAIRVVPAEYRCAAGGPYGWQLESLTVPADPV